MLYASKRRTTNNFYMHHNLHTTKKKDWCSNIILHLKCLVIELMLLTLTHITENITEESTQCNGRSLYYWVLYFTAKNRNMLLTVSGCGALLIMPRLFASGTKKLRFRAFFCLSFVSVLLMVPSEYWKRLEKIFCLLTNYSNENELSSSTVIHRQISNMDL